MAFPFVRYYFWTLKNRNPLISQGIEALILFIWLQSQDYSMIVATLPEPTVRPPSRFSVVEIRVILCDFQGFFGGFFFDMHPVSEVLGIFVIMVLS